jgi:hypothetical protein
MLKFALSKKIINKNTINMAKKMVSVAAKVEEISKIDSGIFAGDQMLSNIVSEALTGSKARAKQMQERLVVLDRKDVPLKEKNVVHTHLLGLYKASIDQSREYRLLRKLIQTPVIY